MSKRQNQSLPQLDGDSDLDGVVEQDPGPNFFEFLIEDFQDMMSNKQVLRGCIEKFIDNLVDQFTLGVVFDLHRKFKTNAYCLEIQESGEEDDPNKVEVLQQTSVKNYQKFSCPNCDRTVAPLGFARHLSKCMGIRDISRSSRIASRRAVTNKDKGDSSILGGVPSDDDDDDEDWNSRRNNKKKDRNGTKKNRTPKKGYDQEASDAVNVDIEGSYDEVTNLRYMMDHGRRSYVIEMQERRSSSTSPTEGTSTTPKKRDKNKRRSKGRDRGSPSTSSLSFD